MPVTSNSVNDGMTSSSAADFPKTKVEAFIKLLRERRPIWDNEHPLFRDRQVKAQCWDDICDKLTDRDNGIIITRAICEAEWKSLRTYYRSLRNPRRLPREKQNEMISKWQYGTLLDFLTSEKTTKNSLEEWMENDFQQRESDSTIHSSSMTPSEGVMKAEDVEEDVEKRNEFIDEDFGGVIDYTDGSDGFVDPSPSSLPISSARLLGTASEGATLGESEPFYGISRKRGHRDPFIDLQSTSGEYFGLDNWRQRTATSNQFSPRGMCRASGISGIYPFGIDSRAANVMDEWDHRGNLMATRLRKLERLNPDVADECARKIDRVLDQYFDDLKKRRSS
ncbi:hypothetical protein AB6A40_007274 [Gnathostoma spinigerum]|uniref:MADF domain-containing protein n=1 Tax=Gnathostoma spinigerum TaxID=75299 RepID=A0ABD6EWC8_9BILA